MRASDLGARIGELLDRARAYFAARSELDEDWPATFDGLVSASSEKLSFVRGPLRCDIAPSELAGRDYLERIPATLEREEAERIRSIRESFAVHAAIHEAAGEVRL